MGRKRLLADAVTRASKLAPRPNDIVRKCVRGLLVCFDDPEIPPVFPALNQDVSPDSSGPAQSG